MTELMSFACPHCNVGLKAPYTSAGLEARCNKCQKAFIVPAQFEFDEPAAKPKPPAAPGTAATRASPGPVFVKPEPKLKVKPSTGQQVAAQAAHVASLLALPVLALAVLGGGAWWFFSSDDAGGEVTSESTTEVAPTSNATVEAATAAEVKRLTAEHERTNPSAETKKTEAAKTEVVAKTALVAAASAPPVVGAAVTAAAIAAAPAGKSSIADLVERYGPSVVVVKTNSGSGAGFVAFADDLIVTNYHVVSGTTSVQVVFIDGKRSSTHSVTVVAIDADNDLALLRLAQPSKARVLEFADDSVLRAGSEVFAIGSPGMGNTILTQSVSNGIISNTERLIGKQRFLQTNAAINPGNSGGPLFDLEGRVVGVVSAKATRQENIGFAVPSSLVQTFHRGRDTTFRVEGDFVKWEGKLPFERLRRHVGAIPLNTYPTGMLLDAERDQLIAISPETNKVIFISLKERKVVREVFTGTDPVALQFGAKNEVWVANSTSKNLVALDLTTGKVIKTISLQHEPQAFTVGRNSIWFMDHSGQAIVVRATGKDESEANLAIRSLAIYGSGGDILCGSATSWLCEFDPDKVQTVIYRRRVQKKAIDDFNADVKNGSSRASQERRDALLKDLADTEKILDRAIKVYNQPAGTDVDFASRQQTLFVDEPHKRIYFNRCVMDLKEPGKIIGVFKSPEHSLKKSESLRAFLEKYPYLNQIHAVSPDGTVAASGTHLYNTADFTIIGELPVPTSAMAFHTDNKTLFLGDPINRQVVGIDFRQTRE